MALNDFILVAPSSELEERAIGNIRFELGRISLEEAESFQASNKVVYGTAALLRHLARA